MSEELNWKELDKILRGMRARNEEGSMYLHNWIVDNRHDQKPRPNADNQAALEQVNYIDEIITRLTDGKVPEAMINSFSLIRAALQNHTDMVDVESLKLTESAYTSHDMSVCSTGEIHMDGWNDCIDHLRAQGHLSAKLEPIEGLEPDKAKQVLMDWPCAGIGEKKRDEVMRFLNIHQTTIIKMAEQVSGFTQSEIIQEQLEAMKLRGDKP